MCIRDRSTGQEGGHAVWELLRCVMGGRKTVGESVMDHSLRWVGIKVVAVCWLFACFHQSACVLAQDPRGLSGPLWKYNASTGWSKTSNSPPKVLTSRLLSLRHIDQSKSVLNTSYMSDNVSALTVPPRPRRLEFGESAMAYISAHALWLIDVNGRLHARFWEAAQDRWAWEDGPLIPAIKSIELTGPSRWLCSGADDHSIFEMSLQLPPWQQQTAVKPNQHQLQPTAKWAQVAPPEGNPGAMHATGLTFGFSTFFVSESQELWELVRSASALPPLHSWTNRLSPEMGKLNAVVALHSVDLPSAMLQQQAIPTEMLREGAQVQNSWKANPWTQQSINLLVFCICTRENGGPQLWSYSLNASFTTGWLQASVSPRKGVWQHHGAPAGMRLTAMPAARIGGVFGESSKGGVFLTSANGSLVERHWDGAEWRWRVFPSPKQGVTILSAPGACINDRSMFVVGSDSNVWEFYRAGIADNGDPSWIWVGHGAPTTAKRSHPVMPTRATAMNNKCLFFRVADGSLVERRWTNDQWKWFYHGSAEKIGALSVEADDQQPKQLDDP
eukprot:TRINITY_DN2622_c0_g1_i1.p1 TRINITY_DN2622_c0_g1~~TRINITY_DN2622_c0_g1_i1.p1  ORF type:complete len:558 (+),score=62.43 TRINITY_DN2622_c0_g1_i1:127-1800(+)